MGHKKGEAKTPKFILVMIWAIVGISVLIFLGLLISTVVDRMDKKAPPPRAAAATRIYPNYKFNEGVNQIKVPLLPAHQVLPREAGGWVILPVGCRYRIDYEMPVIIEYNDGRRFLRKPGEPAYDGAKPGNGIFRIYRGEGEGEGSASVTIVRTRV